MPNATARQRCRTRFRLAAAALAASAAFLLPAWAGTPLRAVETDLASDNERMISYRHQQHMWLTPDGAMHLVMNRGSYEPGGLALYSSRDGVAWQLAHAFADTDDKSTADVQLQGEDAHVVYHTAAGSVVHELLHYDAAAGWASSGAQAAFASNRISAQNPAIAVDAQGGLWVGFLARTKLSNQGNLRVVHRPAGGGWTDPGLVFGPTDNRAVERSARPAAIPGGVGMVWTVREVTYFSRRLDGDAPGAPWSTETVHVGTVESSLADPYASHFNVVTDAAGGVHLVTVDNYDILHFRRDPQTQSWDGPRLVDDTRKVAYAQMGLFNGNPVVGYTVQRGKGTFETGDALGLAWDPTYELAMVPAVPGINYNTARIELPAAAAGTMPVLQQYDVSGVQRLMLYRVPTP
ncbi:hypothetical protein [Rubrivivax gelatinosus]|uniref:Uncharacterized protein n=1 Tax=Rubrivivax gelatinosus TaxID=28068 RepID=A0A4R2M9D6_RUBGE|nr:hypothetical protein [Rubrivivax gelatinosus]MBK1689017.1 hypothetical protein [Rubrivivax gelatinosus]TCP03010.1 hypothetical protein EV684_105176 [Rubrivivax gelatinosus]